MDELNLLDQIDGRLTRLTIGYPAAMNEIWKAQKHVKQALLNPREVDLPMYIDKTKGRLTAMMVNYPDFEEHLRPIVELIQREQRSSPS
jgi:hypothetical protein